MGQTRSRRRGRRRSRLGVVLAVVAAGMLSVGASSAAEQAGPTIVLEPASGLVEFQQVAVSVEGFPASTAVAVAQCAIGGHDPGSCDPVTVSGTRTDESGSMRTSLTLLRTIRTPNGTIDCAIAGACQVIAAAPDDAIVAAVGVQVAPLARAAPVEASCPSPYPPVGYVRGSTGVPSFPPDVSGAEVPYVVAGANVQASASGDVVVLTVELDGVTRRFTSAPHAVGVVYSRSPGPSTTAFGDVAIVFRGDGATFVTLTQHDRSGEVTRIGWRFDEPCPSTASAPRPPEPVAHLPSFTG